VSVLSNYTTLAKRHEQEEVKRCFELERHTVSTLLNLVQAHGWTDHIDLVEGGRSQWIVKEASRETLTVSTIRRTLVLREGTPGSCKKLREGAGSRDGIRGPS